MSGGRQAPDKGHEQASDSCLWASTTARHTARRMAGTAYVEKACPDQDRSPSQPATAQSGPPGPLPGRAAARATDGGRPSAQALHARQDDGPAEMCYTHSRRFFLSGLCPSVLSTQGRIASPIPKTQMRASVGAHLLHPQWGWQHLLYGVAILLSIRGQAGELGKASGSRAPQSSSSSSSPYTRRRSAWNWARQRSQSAADVCGAGVGRRVKPRSLPKVNRTKRMARHSWRSTAA